MDLATVFATVFAADFTGAGGDFSTTTFTFLVLSEADAFGAEGTAKGGAIFLDGAALTTGLAAGFVGFDTGFVAAFAGFFATTSFTDVLEDALTALFDLALTTGLDTSLTLAFTFAIGFAAGLMAVFALVLGFPSGFAPGLEGDLVAGFTTVLLTGFGFGVALPSAALRLGTATGIFPLPSALPTALPPFFTADFTALPLPADAFNSVLLTGPPLQPRCGQRTALQTKVNHGPKLPEAFDPLGTFQLIRPNGDPIDNLRRGFVR